MQPTLENKLEAILFYKNEPMEIKGLSSILNTKESEVKDGLKSLSESLKGRGICLILTENEASLATAPQMKELIEQIAKDEMSKEIGKAGLETLSIILYNKQGISRKRIDYIRGVNSTFILRNLLSRGLIERAPGREGERSFVYKPTLALLAYLGIKDISELPESEAFIKEMESEKEITGEE